ncbi:XdhC family protein [Gracilibacillus oryzae]|uniref:XdhC family protein n=1 Tax=Gracilibacillus oryzae TaxID=1672701 RepID=A0A7C8GUI7_9BACI|nr:XdhC family protein [Gracilibacillus oryzae]KAB8138259.1 XdhC family protein [Gracilibacillus oryzae]
MIDIHEILEHVSSDADEKFLATIVHVDGSAYKKEGAMMLVRKDGTRIGMLSGGCLEEDIVARIEHSEFGSKPEMIIYDMKEEDEQLWGQNTGCNGVISVLIEPVTKLLQQDLAQVKKKLDKGQNVILLKEIPDEESEMNYLFYTEGGQIIGRKGVWLENLIPFIPGGAATGTKKIGQSGKRVYVAQLKAKPRLLIFGANDDVKPLVRLAANVGFRVEIASWQEAYCHEANFPDASHFYIGFPNELERQLTFSVRDFIILQTHNFQRDQELLAFLKEKNLQYIGILGSKRRTKRLLGCENFPDNVYSPVGLSIGAQGPEEIAVSIVAELIQQKYKLKGAAIRESG